MYGSLIDVVFSRESRTLTRVYATTLMLLSIRRYKALTSLLTGEFKTEEKPGARWSKGKDKGSETEIPVKQLRRDEPDSDVIYYVGGLT
jgi:hypothetical protein